MSRFGSFANMKTLWGSNNIVLDVDFTKSPLGSITAPAGFATPCASGSRTVQTGTGADTSRYPVVSGIAANLALIGREQDFWLPGLVVEGPVANVLPDPRTMASGWSAGASETFVAQSVGVDSPDGSVNAPSISVLSAGYSRKFSSSGGASCLSSWRRQYAPSAKRCFFGVYTTAGDYYGPESGTVQTTWAKDILAKVFGSGVVFVWPVYGNSNAASGYASNAACSARLDMLQEEAGLISHEFYAGSKLGGGFTCDASRVVMGGRISMYWKGRPKGSINGSNPWTYNPWILYLDVNNNMLFNAITGIVTVTVAGAAFNCPIPIDFYRASLVEIWVEAGGGSLVTVVKAKVDGVITTLGTSASPQGTFPSSGTLGICCNAGNLTTGQFESWVNRVTFYVPGCRPAPFDSDPYQLVQEFRGLTLGAPATPSGLTYTCATAARTVQTGSATVISGIGANAIRVGRENSTWMPGLVLEGPVVNALTNPRTLASGWSAASGGETFTAQSAGSNSPDGTVTSPFISESGTFISRYKFATSQTLGAASVWKKSTTNRRTSFYGGTVKSIESGVGTNSWEKANFSWAATSTTLSLVLFDNTTSAYATTTALSDGFIDFTMFETGTRVPHEFIDGTKATETLSVPVASAVVNGRLGFYCKFRPKFSSSGRANPAAAAPCIWQIDASNLVLWYANLTGVMQVVIGGVSRNSLVNTPAFNRGDEIEFWLEAGSGQTIVWMRINGVMYVIPFQAETSAALPSSGTLRVLSYSGGSNILEAWHATFRTYKPGLRPDFQDPNILWRADFTKLQAGTDATPQGMSVTCATSARTVQVGDNLLVSGITNDVLLIGRESSAWALGAVLEGAVTNNLPLNRVMTGTGWTAGNETSFTAQSAGVDSPDNTVTSLTTTLVNPNTFGRYANSFSTYTKAVCSFWRKTTTNKRALFGAGVAGDPLAAIESGVGSGAWEKAMLRVNMGVPTLMRVMLIENRAAPYATTSSNNSGQFDFGLAETGQVSHEWIAASKVGTVHSVPAATVVSASRLSMHAVMRPKGSIAGTNPWTWNPLLWKIDANNYCSINATTGIVTSVVAGTPLSSLTGVAFNRGDRIEWWYAGGGGVLGTTIKVRVNGGAVQSFSLAAQGTVPNSGNIGMGCDPAAPASGSLEGWYELCEYYVGGTSPAWAA